MIEPWTTSASHLQIVRLLSLHAKKQKKLWPCPSPELPNKSWLQNSELLVLQLLPWSRHQKSANIAKEVKLIEPEVVKPIHVQINHLGSRNPPPLKWMIALCNHSYGKSWRCACHGRTWESLAKEAHSTIILDRWRQECPTKIGYQRNLDPFTNTIVCIANK